MRVKRTSWAGTRPYRGFTCVKNNRRWDRVRNRGAHSSGMLREIPKRGQKTEMFTTVSVKRGVGGLEIENKGLYETRGTHIFEALPRTFHRDFFLKHESSHCFNVSVNVLYIQK